jgi:predicted nucleic acid-binding protein
VRDEANLAFIGTTSIRLRKLLYDTTVYIDILQNRFSQNGEPTLRAAEAWHSPVTEAGLAAGIGLLGPARPHTREITEKISIECRASYRTIASDPEIWREAGILSGVLARLQGYGPNSRRRALSDALLFATARKHGCTVLLLISIFSHNSIPPAACFSTGARVSAKSYTIIPRSLIHKCPTEAHNSVATVSQSWH